MREIMLVKTRQVRRHEYVNNKGENRHSIKFSSGGEQFTLVFQSEAERDLWYWSMLACKQMTQKEQSESDPFAFVVDEDCAEPDDIVEDIQF